jgi:hypothetical protein
MTKRAWQPEGTPKTTSMKVNSMRDQAVNRQGMLEGASDPFEEPHQQYSQKINEIKKFMGTAKRTLERNGEIIKGRTN